MGHPELNILPGTARLLVEGGDKRNALDPALGVNRYGCAPKPDPGLLDFSSATASVISTEAYAAADALRKRLERDIRFLTPAELYARELDRMRRELLGLCAPGDLPEPDIVFAPSGTDLHRIAAQLARAGTDMPLLVLMVGETETGSSILAAVTDSCPEIEVARIALRMADGSPRNASEIDGDFTERALQAQVEGRKVLLIQTDVSKTGMIAPGYGCTAALQQKLGEQLDVLIDACQFRIAPATLRACLERGYSVALTGSKFIGGPSFSGVLMIPDGKAAQMRKQVLPRMLKGYSAAADWPDGWHAGGVLRQTWNFGMLLRWEAALSELRAFRALPDAGIAGFVESFGKSIQDKLSRNMGYSAVAVPELERSGLPQQSGWDRFQTIFPFQLYRVSASKRQPLGPDQTREVYRLLPSTAIHCQLGQPVNYGADRSALRLCLSARLIVQALAGDDDAGDRVIAQAGSVIDQAARLANMV